MLVSAEDFFAASSCRRAPSWRAVALIRGGGIHSLGAAQLSPPTRTIENNSRPRREQGFGGFSWFLCFAAAAQGSSGGGGSRVPGEFSRCSGSSTLVRTGTSRNAPGAFAVKHLGGVCAPRGQGRACRARWCADAVLPRARTSTAAGVAAGRRLRFYFYTTHVTSLGASAVL